MEWLIPEYGHANGDEKIVIKGTKMTCRKFYTLSAKSIYDYVLHNSFAKAHGAYFLFLFSPHSQSYFHCDAP